MAQRLNKKLLLGLGSSLGFLGTGVVSGFGVNAIVNTNQDNIKDQLALNAITEADFKSAPDYNVATREMFTDTTDLKRFHFGNTQIGQTVTANGWLGVFENSNNKANKIALTGWNGEIIWINDDYANETNPNAFNVYDMKYDYNTNLIFVLRTSDPRGISNGSVPLTMDVLDARNGQRVDQINSTTFQSIQRDAYNSVTNTAYFKNTINDSVRSKNLFQLDIASKPGSNEVLVTWMPNFMQLVANTGDLPSFFSFKHVFNTAMRGFRFRVANNNNTFNVSHTTINFPRMDQLFTISTIIWQDVLWGFKSYEQKNFTLLANPFFTTDNSDGAILHLILASNGKARYTDNLNPPSDNDRNGEQILHATFGFNKNWTENRNNLIVQQIGGRTDAFKPADYPELNTYKNWPFKINLHESWLQGVQLNANMTRANLRINKNMFDNNSLVFAYPYASGSAYPIYNVMQLNLNPNNGRILYDYSANNKKRTMNWEFGKNINDYYNTNKNSYGTSTNPTGDYNRIYPFPINNIDVNHNYNRLISVSPFDNTFIYGAKSSLKYPALQSDNNSNNNKYASFWIASDELRNNKPRIRPLVIANDNSIGSQTIDSYMTNVPGLYTDGFTFDPRSLVDRSGIKSLNLYFNQNGTGKNDSYADNNMLSSKIGLLNDVLVRSSSGINQNTVVWVDNIATPYKKTEPDNTTFNLLTTGITKDSYSTLIHSRANLPKWYIHSWTNSNKPANMFSSNQRLNDPDTSADRAIAKSFSQPLNDPDVNSNKGVDLVSAWKDKNGNNKYAKNPPNYNRLAIKRPFIKVGSTSLRKNALSVSTIYELTPDAKNEVFKKPGWAPNANNTTNLTLTNVETIENVSYQIVSSWQSAYKMQKIFNNTTSGFNTSSVAWQEQSTPQWLDKIIQANLSFGTGNNNVAKQGIQPLRLMLKLVLPTGDLPEWFKSRFNENNDLFKKAYPIESSYPGETTFREVVNEFANLKAKHINLSDNKNANAPVGLGNLKIEAYLELNPKFVNNQSTDKIYKLPDGKTKFLFDKTTNERIFYKDDFDPNKGRLIYDQSQINYEQFQQGAFGQPNTSLRNTIQKSWANGVLKNNFNIKVATNYDQLPDTLVRTAVGNNEPIFRFVYIENNSKLELTPTDPAWFKNRMENYNRLLNLFVQFEYQTANDNANTWNALGSFLTDSQIKTKMQNGKLILEARNSSDQIITNIKKLRFKLTTKGNANTSDPNISVWQENFQRDEPKYISDPNPLAIENFVVQSSYISGTILTNANQSINSLTKADIDNFIEQVKAKSSTTDADLRAKVSLTFDYNNKTDLNAQQLFDEIKAQREGTEPFSLWNGTNGANRIRAKFILLSTEGIQFVKPNGQTAAESDLRADVQANLKTEVDLTAYLNQLINGSLKLKNQPTVPGQMNGQDILFPENNAISGYFATDTFEEIKNKLESKLGVKVRFRAWNNQQNNWGAPTYNVNDLTTYDVSRPEIGLSLEQQTNWNSKVIYNSTELGADNWFSLKLSLPKIIKNPNANDISKMIADFNKENIFSGNTWELIVGNNLAAGKLVVVDTLIKASTTNPQDYNELKTNDALLVLEFKLGNSNWMQAADLKTELAKQTVDQNDSSLKMRIKLSSEDNFILATDLQTAEFQLLDNNNDVIKKWIHGTKYENVLKAGTAVTLKSGSTKNNLKYNYHNDISELFNSNGREGLVIQWRLGSENANNWKDLKGAKNPLPPSVNNNEQNILIRVAADRNNNTYLYGPEVNGGRSEFSLNLSQIPVQIEIDNDWFNQETLTIEQGKFLQDITEQSFTNYENSFFARSNSLSGPDNTTLRAKVKLIYQFNKVGKWMSGAEMAQSIRQKLNNFNSSDQGVWVLSHDGSTYKKQGFDKNVYVINAQVTTVKPNDSTIEFINPNAPDQPISADQLAGNLKSNIQTKVDLNAWLNEILNAGITAARGQNPGQLNSATIQIPGKKAAASGQSQVQFGGKDFNTIEQILNKVNVFVRYKKYDAKANNYWSGWLDNKTLVDTYDVKNPQIVLGFKKPHNAGTNNDRILLNIKVFNGSTEFNDDTPFVVKLNVPKLIKNPTNIDETIRKFNQTNPFSGNTFNLEINSSQLKIAENQLINDIKTASQGNSRFDNLETALTFKYKLGTADWDTAEGLKDFLSKQTIDQTSNELKIKVELKPTTAGTVAEFELDPNGVWEYVLQNDNNTIIKKWLHGSTYEAALQAANAIVANGNKNALTYTFSRPLELFANESTFPTGLTLEYQLNGNGNWTKGVLPTTVDPSVNNIKVKIAKQDKQQIYLYGPEEQKKQQQAVVDLTKIPVLVEIDKNWFSQIAITDKELQLENLTENHLNIWENKIWQKAGLDAKPEIKNKLAIKYSFLDASAGRSNLDKTNLKTSLIAEQSKYGDPTHHGIVKLNDSSVPNNGQPNGIIIKATFVKVDPKDVTIQFVDANGTNIDPNDTDKTTGAVNTQNIQTTFNLSNYINHLKNTPTNVTTAGTAGTIAQDGLVPPVLNGNVDQVLFATKSFKEIEQLLKNAGLEFLWSINGQDPWKTTANTNQYNPQIGHLFLALNNNSTNLKVQLEPATFVNPGQNSFKNPIIINLNAPKVINVQPANAIVMKPFFSGNTKYLNVNTTQIKAQIDTILNQQGNQFTGAPLTLLVKIGEENFVDYKELEKTLKDKSTDVKNGLVTVKFAIDNQQANANQFEIIAGGEEELLLIDDPTVIKTFINDQGIFNNLSTKTTLNGLDNTSFQFVWPNGWTLGQDGILNAQDKGKGLRLEFSFANLDQANGPVGTNIDQQWVKNPPNSYPLDKKKIYIRLQTENNYVYERIESNKPDTPITAKNQPYKFDLDLNLPQSIEVNQQWLSQTFSTKIIDLANIQEQDFQTYEDAVKNQITHTDDIKAKISIGYLFNGEPDVLTKKQLIAKFQQFQQQVNDLDQNFGILKLWNSTAGIQIKTTFVKANPTDDSYKLTWINNQTDPVIINTEKVQTTIDLTNVVQWLETIKVQFTAGNQENTITNLNLEGLSVSANGSPFNQKTWAQTEQVLEALNIRVQYLPVFANSNDNDWKESADEIQKYDNRGIFKIRFKLEANKAKNLMIKFKQGVNFTGNTTDVFSDPLQVQLKIVRKIIVDQQTVETNFINQKAISGNTKFLQINSNIETALIKAIEKYNNDLLPAGSQQVFNNTNLKILYAIGDATNWQKQAEFIASLKTLNTDQTKNLIRFKFTVETPTGQETQFSVDENEYQFNPNDEQGLKIKFFVHTADWEQQADQIQVDGKTNALNWNFNAFGAGKFEEVNDQVYLKTVAGKLLQLHFTTNANARYDDATLGNGLDELATKWIKTKPTSIKATDKLFVRISPVHSGIVYEAAGDPTNNINPSARVHQVQLTITQVVKVKKAWFNTISITNNEIEINDFNFNLLNQWSTNLKNEIKKLNQFPDGQTTDELLAKIKLQFSLDGNGTYDAAQLIQTIQVKLKDYNGNDLGIIQLWNPQNKRGLKIGVKFVSVDEKQVSLEEVDNDNLTQDVILNTAKIYTLIDLKRYVSVLQSEKTTVTKKPGAVRPEEISAFMPPNGNDPTTGFLNEKSYEQIAKKLNDVGITIEFSAEFQNPQWVPKDQIQQYNPRINKLFIRFSNVTNNNLKLQINQNTIISQSQNSGTTEIALPLAVPRQISINTTSDLVDFATLMNFGENTKKITYEKNGAQKVIDKILKRNATESQNDQEYLQAPLKVKFAIGNTTQYEEVTNDQLKQFLANYPDDLTSREIRWKFDLDEANAQEWIFDPASNGIQGTLVSDGVDSPIKIYINDKGLYNDLQAPNLQGSTSEQLRFDWSAKKITIDPQTGVVSATEINDSAKVRGLGLRVEFSYVKGLTGAASEPEDQDPFKGWSKLTPQRFDVNFSTDLLVRIRLTDNNKYFYENVDKKFIIDLSKIPTVIKLNGNWLKQSFSNQPIPLENLEKKHFQAYEDQVWQVAGLGQVDQPRVKISYHFVNNDYLDVTTLLEAIKAYQAQHAGEANFGFLQLWNGNQGEKITTKFVKANPADPQYSLQIENDNPNELDLSKVITTIDFSAVLTWLKATQIPITENGNKIAVKIPNVETPGTPFSGQSWSSVENALLTFGIVIEYSKNLADGVENWGTLNTVDQYNPKSPTFKMRFRADTAKAQNIKIKLENPDITLDGAANQPSNAYVLQLKARLLVEIKPALLSKFISDANITGNTKFINIADALNAQNALITSIIDDNKANDNRYEQLKDQLELQFVMQKTQPDDAALWKILNDFQTYLSEQDSDQVSNQIWYRIVLKDKNNFNINANDEAPKVLSNHQASTAADLKIHYYVNGADWEAKAANVQISGPSNNLIWNFETAFGKGKFRESNGEVYLITNAGQALKMYFIIDNPQAQYDQPEISDDPTEIKSKWVSKKPQAIPAGTTSVKIKLMANVGFVYGPAADKPQTAAAHDVTINVQNILFVNKDWLNDPLLNQEKELNALKETDFQTWEEKIYRLIEQQNQTNAQTARKVKIKYFFDGNNKNQYSAAQLIEKIGNLSANYGDQKTLGIVNLWSNQSNQGTKIEAIFTIDPADQNQYALRVPNVQGEPSETDLKNLVDTSNVYTSISLSEYIEVLKKEKTTVTLTANGNAGDIDNFTVPMMPGKIGDKFLSGYSFEQIVNRLAAVGIQAKFAKTASKVATDWKPKNEIKSYDIQTSVLFLSFEINNNANVKIRPTNTEILEPGQNMYGDKAIKLPLDVPKYIIIDSSKDFWLTIKDGFDFRENTKFIQFNETNINNFITKILQENFNASNDESYKQAPLKIAFQVGNQEFTETTKLKAYLQNLPNDLPNRTINFKFIIPDDQAQNWQLQNPNQIYSLLTESQQDQAQISKLKIYINDKNIFEDLKETKLSGSSQNLIWKFKNLSVNPDDGVLSSVSRGVGLKIEFTLNENADEKAAPGTDINKDWVAKMPTSFNVNQTKILIRVALVDDNLYTYVNKYKKIELLLTDIVRVLNLNSNWLEKIVLSGTTKVLEINEDQALAQLRLVLPNDQPNLVQLKYSIDGLNWQSVADFKEFLKQQNGKKDKNHFILKREDLKVRFELDPTQNNKFQMIVDQKPVKPDNSDSPIVQLINDKSTPPLNSGTRGVIELENLKYFIKNNFAIQGSNTNPVLKIKNRTEIDNLLQIYASDELFDIKITGITTNNNFDWANAVSILDQGKLIAENGLAQAGFVLDGNKKVALRFESKDAKYDVYFNGTMYQSGYPLDISDNVQVTFEIKNPFTKNKKTLTLWWTEDGDKTKGKYYQGEGGFKIVNGNQQGDPDLVNYQSSLEWLQSSQSGLADKEKTVLEFVYHIYEDKPDAAQIENVNAKINDYGDATWKQLDPILDKNGGDDFTNPLDLKVGQYVSVALRVKQKYASGDDVYSLKDNDHSFVDPIKTNTRGQELGRAHGYKVKTSDVNIDNDKIVLENFLNTEQAPLDGYTNIKNLSLIKDQNENYKGVDLELQLFHQFYRQKNQPDSVIITPFDKIKLIKRQKDPTVTINDYFKDANGQQIKDENDQPIPILLDDQGRPTIPEEATAATFNEKFTNYDQGFFGMTIPQDSVKRNQWGIFKNQSVKVVFGAHQGVGGATDPDFILDDPKTVDLKNQISPQIKFPIFNQDNIKYEFNYDEFKKDQINFVNALNPEQGPAEGKSKVGTLIKLIKTKNNGKPETIEGTDENGTIEKLKNELQTSFKNKLQFETIYEPISGGKQVANDLDLYKFRELKNGDRIKVNIVSADSDFIWAEPPKTLAIQVSGLTTKAPQRDKLRYLRVEQNGKIDGQGSFKVLVNNPNDLNSDAKDILEGWKFVLRVWNSDRNIKHDWTANQEKINDLKNGDKVEWKLLDEFGNPVEDAYYNTIAGDHKIDSETGSTTFNFQQMNYPNGKESGQIVQDKIGNYPENSELYPEESGFVISGLQNALEIFEITDAAFAKVMAQLEPHYVGLNGQGTINFKEDYLSKNYYVNSNGELYEKPFDQPTFKQQVDTDVVEISLADFLANTTFYTSDPNLINYQNGFKFLGNDTNLNNHLSNGDQVWAQFDLRADNNEVNRGISTELNPVTGLKDVVTDPMTPLWYILMAIAGIVSLGGLSLLMIWAKRNRKFKK